MKYSTSVTGMGIVCSIRKNVREFTNSLREGICGIGTMEYLKDAPVGVKLGAEIKRDNFEKFLEEYYGPGKAEAEIISRARQAARRAPLPVQWTVAAAMEAWDQAKLSGIDAERIGIVVAGSNLSQNLQYSLNPGFLENPEYISPNYALNYLDTNYVGTLSEIFGIHGEGFSVGGASSSGNVGIIKAFQLLQLGILDVCMVVGAPAVLSPMEIQSFCNIGAMGGKFYANKPQEACRPFDMEHEGFIYGQGAACIIMESSEFAKNRDALIYAEILGGAIVLDGNRLSNPSEEGEVRAMTNALSQAGVKAEQINYINAHGTASPIGDETEVNAVKRVFSENLKDIRVNSTKGLTGHCLYSAGVVEAVAAIIQMNEGFLHPNLNLVNPIDMQIRFCGPEKSRADILYSMSNSFGFGGFNTSIVLRRGETSYG